MKNRITVIIVCFNSAATISETLHSLSGQTISLFDVIIVDGGSTDKTLEIIKNYGSLNYRLLSEKDKGLYDAMNKGIDLVDTEYFMFLNSDDRLHENTTVEKILNSIKKNSHTLYNYSIAYFGGRTDRKWILSDELRSGMDFEYVPPHPGFIVKTEFIRENDVKFDLSYSICADMKFMLSVINLLKGEFVTSSQIVSEMRIGGLSNHHFLKRVREYYLIYREFNLSKLTILHIIIRRFYFKFNQ